MLPELNTAAQAPPPSQSIRRVDFRIQVQIQFLIELITIGADLTGEEMLKQRLAKPVIVHENTRFSTTPFDDRQSQIAVKMAAQSNAKQTGGMYNFCST